MPDVHRSVRWAIAVYKNPRSGIVYSKGAMNPEVGGWSTLFNGGSGAPKCNVFVWDALGAGGLQPRTVNGERRIAYVSDWNNRKSRIDGFRPLNVDNDGHRSEPLRDGDIIANRGHVGMIVGVDRAGTFGLTASAADPHHGDKVTVVPFGFRAIDGPIKQIVVWRHYSTESRGPQTKRD